MNEYILETILSVLFCIGLPPLFFIQLRKRWMISWIIFIIGVGSFLFSQVIHLPLNTLLASLHWTADFQDISLPDLLHTSLILGLTAGLCEELTRWLVLVLLSKFRKRSLNFVGAIGLGLGHGGIEAMIIGGIFVSANITTALTLKLNNPGVFQITADNWAAIQGYFLPIISLVGAGFLPLIERLLAMVLHLSLSIWV